MKVVVTDYTFPTLAVEEAILGPAGVELSGAQAKTRDALRELVADADAVITQFAPVDSEVIAVMKRARVIVRYGIGVDNVDLEAARDQGIPVCNVPDYCIDEVADHTLGLLLATTRQLMTNAAFVRRGKWGLATPLDRMLVLRDLTVGVVGYGRIGREVTSRLQSFKCRVVVYDPLIPATEIERSGCEAVDQSRLWTESHVITLHCPSTKQTRGMINREALDLMRPGVVIINVARGDLVDSDALTEALIKGHVSAAALDVFAPEPIPLNHPILAMENVIVTSHIASASVPAVEKLRTTAAMLALAAIRGEPLASIVNGVSQSRVH